MSVSVQPCRRRAQARLRMEQSLPQPMQAARPVIEVAKIAPMEMPRCPRCGKECKPKGIMSHVRFCEA